MKNTARVPAAAGSERMTAEERLRILRRLRSSCLEGYDGRWDCTTDEGRESFLPMVDELDLLIRDAELDRWKEKRKEGKDAEKKARKFAAGPAAGRG